MNPCERVGGKKNRAWLLSISRLYTWVEIPFWREEVVSSLMLVPPRLVCVRVIVASGWSRDVWTAARPRLVLLCWVPHAYCCWKPSACSSSFGLRVDSSIFLVISLSFWFSSSDFPFSLRSSFSTLHKFSFTPCLYLTCPSVLPTFSQFLFDPPTSSRHFFVQIKSLIPLSSFLSCLY